MASRKHAGSRRPVRDRRPGYRYLRVKETVTSWLGEGRWRFGEAIPSETALARQFGVSVGTIRHSIEELVAEGILARQHGRGTFVASHTKDYLYNVFFRIVDRDGGRRRAVPKLISFRRGYADRTTAASLRIPTGAAIYRIANLITLDDAPVAYDDIRLPQRLFPGLASDDLAQRGTTVYGVLQRRYRIDAIGAREMIAAVKAGKTIGSALGLHFDSPVLRIQRTAYSYGGVPIDFRYRYVSTATHRYLITLGRAAGLE
ncbi:MAG: GntR family transcriptional regulator [Betaproteobacteria bacterium]|nr:GntR family transcriptional regulator [Betaproteobacteria bacterium]